MGMLNFTLPNVSHTSIYNYFFFFKYELFASSFNLNHSSKILYPLRSSLLKDQSVTFYKLLTSKGLLRHYILIGLVFIVSFNNGAACLVLFLVIKPLLFICVLSVG